MISQECACEIVREAFIAVCENDTHLLVTRSNERSVTHRFAVYIEQEMPIAIEHEKYDVDCEYNRSDREPKRLLSFKRKNRK